VRRFYSWRGEYSPACVVRAVGPGGLPLGSATHFYCCHSNATRAPIANPPNSAQLGASPTTPPSYMRVRAIVQACGREQTLTQTDTHTHTQTHRRAWPQYISRRLRLTRNVNIGLNITHTIAVIFNPIFEISTPTSHVIPRMRSVNFTFNMAYRRYFCSKT